MKLRSGHAPGHVRAAFCDAIEAYAEWEPGEPEPMVDYEVNYEARQVLISHTCGLLWNCSDILPGDYFRLLQDRHPDLVRRTYAACARAMLAEIRATNEKEAA
jgi:hypothetical protein